MLLSRIFHGLTPSLMARLPRWGYLPWVIVGLALVSGWSAVYAWVAVQRGQGDKERKREKRNKETQGPKPKTSVEHPVSDPQITNRKSQNAIFAFAFCRDATSNALLALLLLDLLLSPVLAWVFQRDEFLPLSVVYLGVFVAGLWAAAKVWQKDNGEVRQGDESASSIEHPVSDPPIANRQSKIQNPPDPFLRYAAIACGVYILIFGALGVLQCRALSVQHIDSVTFDRMYWNTLHGRYFQSNGPDSTFLADHVSLTMSLLLPIYALFPSIATVSLFQTFGIGLGGVPVYLIAREVMKHRGAAMGFCIAYLANPALHYSNLEVRDNVFDPNSFSAMLILWAFYFALRDRWKRFFLMSALAMMCREDLCPSVFMMGLYLAIVRRQWKPGLGVAAMGLGWLLLVLYVIVPHFRDDRSLVFNYFSEMGEGGGGMLGYILQHPLKTLSRITTVADIRFLVELALPFGMLALLAPEALLMAAPAFAFSMLADPKWYAIVSIQFWYHIVHIPLVTIASIMGAQRLVAIISSQLSVIRGKNGREEEGESEEAIKNQKSKIKNLIAFLVVVCSFGLSIFISKGPWSIGFYDPDDTYRHYSRYQAPPEVQHIPEMQALIPRTASVSATPYLTQKFTKCDYVWYFPVNIDKADYVVTNFNDRWFRMDFDTSGDLEAAKKMEDRKDFKKVFEKGSLVVFRRVSNQ